MKVARSQIFSSPIRALAGLIKCKCCEAAIVQVSAKSGGYYGCYIAMGESCDNKQWLSRTQVGAIILNDLKEKFLTVDSLRSTDGLALKGLLGAIQRKIAQEDSWEQHNTTSFYYVAHTSIQTVALLDEEFC